MLKQKQIHTRWSLAPTILALAWPTMLEQLLQTAVQYIDTAMVGALGTHATAAVGATTTINWLIGSTISALGIGFLAYISQNHGAGNLQQIKKASAQAALVVLVCGLLVTAVALYLSPKVPVWMRVDEQIRSLSAQYFFVLYTPMLARTAMIIFGTLLRAVGDTKTPMRIGLLVNIINVVLNFLLIYPTRTVGVLSLQFVMPGAGLGVVGAAAASAIAYTVGGIMITGKIWKHALLSPKEHSLKPDWDVLRPCLRVALPNALQRFGTSFGYVAFAAMINSLGEVATAAHTIANTVESAFYIPGFGMQTAAATLAGNALGANDEKRLRDLSKTMLLIEVLLMLLSGALLFAVAPGMVSLFSKDEQVILLSVTVLRMVAVSEPFYGVSIIIEGMLLGMGKTVTPFVFNIIGMWGVRIVGTFVCAQLLGMGLVAAWACMILHNLILFVLFTICYASGRWNPFRKRQ